MSRGGSDSRLKRGREEPRRERRNSPLYSRRSEGTMIDRTLASRKKKDSSPEMDHDSSDATSEDSNSSIDSSELSEDGSEVSGATDTHSEDDSASSDNPSPLPPSPRSRRR